MSALAGRLAEALKMCASVLSDDCGTDANDWIDAELAARTALAAWEESEERKATRLRGRLMKAMDSGEYTVTTVTQPGGKP